MVKSQLVGLTLALAGVGTAVMLTSTGCVDEVHAEEVAALGPEAPGVSPGPTHRPGQPCLACHGGSGPGSPQLSIAGTVYLTQGSDAPAPNTQVQIEDIEGRLWTVTSNSAGNFFVTLTDFAPQYPTQVQVTSGSVLQPMLTHIGRDGSCADCHSATVGPTSAGLIYLNASADGG